MKKCVALLIVWVAFATAPAFADFQKGYDAFNKGDYATALREFHPLAEQGDAISQYNLGYIYDKGHGVPQNYSEAVKWFTLSAEQGYTGSQVKLGFMYNNGHGVSQNHKEAIKWYRRAAEQGDEMGQAKLGVANHLGWGIPQDYVRAHMWFNLSASNGNKNAEEVRGDIAKLMTPTQIEKAQKLAQECLAKNYKNC